MVCQMMVKRLAFVFDYLRYGMLLEISVGICVISRRIWYLIKYREISELNLHD